MHFLLIKLYARILCPFRIVLFNDVKLSAYSRFQITFQSAVAKFVLNIPNYITKFEILRGNLLNQICKLLKKVLKYQNKVLNYQTKVLKWMCLVGKVKFNLVKL